jgi:hypothetical protein
MVHEKNRVGDELLLQLFAGYSCYHRYNDAAHFRDRHANFVAAGCAVLKFLSYLEPDDNSAFGVRPTPSFIHHLLTALEPDGYSRSRQPTNNDQTIIKKLIEVSGWPEYWGFEGMHGQGKLSLLLVNLKLAYWAEDQKKVIPTDELYQEYGDATDWDLPDEL